ncbi:DMT family transporter [uncultured Clostridium sp.]|uniref:DMT family transporter n=1 Tax=uncultured Clostridium sp. TaxID=59620 RepID=UPI002602753F|nr:DMT family transporter [uncultured Clostridium sp.]
MSKYKGYIFILLTALCFSTQEISGKYLAMDNLNAYQINAIAFLIGATILLPVAIKDIKKMQIHLTGKDWAYFLLLGIIQVSVGMSLMQEALVYTTPAIVAVLVCSNAIMTVPLAKIFCKESFDPRAWIAIALAAVGIVVIFNPFASAGGKDAHQHLIGVTLALLGALSIALFNVLATKKIKQYGKAVTNSFSFYLGVLVMFIFMLIFHVPIIKGIDLHSFTLLLYVGIVVKGLGFFFFLGAMKETSAITATSVFYIKPILVPILMLLIMGEMITMNVLIGTIIIIAASLIIFQLKRMNAKKLAMH